MGWQDRRFDRYDEGRVPGWKRALRRTFVENDNFFSWAFPLFTLWGIRVRIHVLFVAYVLVELFRTVRPDVYGLQFVAIKLGTLFGLVLIHEFGHCLACRRVGGTADEIILWPLGGLAMCKPPHHWKASLITTLGGPATHIPMGVLLGGVLLALGAPMGVLIFNPLNASSAYLTHPEFFQGQNWLLHYALWAAYVTNLGLFLFNMLLIMFPMDAGRVLQELLWWRMGYRKSMMIATTIGLGLAVLIGMWALSTQQNQLVSIAMFGGLTCFAERRRVSMMEDSPWSSPIPDVSPVRDRKAEREYQKALRQQQAERQSRAAEAAEENRILDKISAEGMGSLSRKEREFLDKLSERRRRESGNVA